MLGEVEYDCRCKCSVQIVQSCLDGSLLRAAAKTWSRLGLEWHHESERTALEGYGLLMFIVGFRPIAVAKRNMRNARKKQHINKHNKRI